MKILILGDFSGFGKNLRKGFIQLKCDVDLISSGDSWKKITSDSINLDYSYKNIFERLYKGLKNRKKLWEILKNNKYDVILVMNQGFINFTGVKKELSLTFKLEDLKKMLNSNGKIYLLACGTDKYYLECADIFYKEKGYYTRTSEEIEKIKPQYDITEEQEKKFIDVISKVIPIAPDYLISYKNSIWNTKKKVYKIIPLCLNSEEINPKNELKEKIKIFHGVSRENIKGSKFIIQAMENIKKKYPDKVEIKIVHNLPFDIYQKELEDSNIMLDQCKSISYGMNALYGMAMGKLVFSGNENENEKEMGIKNIPVVNIIPDVEDIEKKLEYYILNPKLIASIGKKSRTFIETYHNNKIVAKQYLELFENDKKI